MRILSIAAASVCLSLPLVAQTANTQKQLLAARDTVWRAWFANDTALLHRFIPASATAADGVGKVRWTDRSAILSGARQSAASGTKLENIEFTGTHIDASGSSAMVRSHFRYVLRHGNKADTVGGRAAELFVLDNGRWVNPFWHLEYDQTPAGARLLDLPDTLGAAVNVADSAQALGSITDYDALIGTWEFTFQWRNPDGTFGDTFTGHWTFEKKGEGGIIEDHWRPDNPTALMSSSLYTYRIFDPQLKSWKLIGANSRGGRLTPGVTWGDANNRYGIEHSGGALVRFRYFALGPNRFLWRQDQSHDGGKTWLLDTGVMDAHRIGK